MRGATGAQHTGSNARDQGSIQNGWSLTPSARQILNSMIPGQSAGKWTWQSRAGRCSQKQSHAEVQAILAMQIQDSLQTVSPTRWRCRNFHAQFDLRRKPADAVPSAEALAPSAQRDRTFRLIELPVSHDARAKQALARLGCSHAINSLLPLSKCALPFFSSPRVGSPLSEPVRHPAQHARGVSLQPKPSLIPIHTPCTFPCDSAHATSICADKLCGQHSQEPVWRAE